MSILALLLSFLTNAQETVVVGQVFSETDKSPIANVNIYFKNSEIGTKTNEEGFFLLRTQAKVSSLVFSCIGYVKKEIKINQGQSIGLQLELKEEVSMLQEVFVIPGTNPAIELMKKVRLMRTTNDERNWKGYNSERTEQNLVLLGKINQKNSSKLIFNQLQKSTVSLTDTNLTLPLYMSENKIQFANNKKNELTKNTFNTNKNIVANIESLIGGFQPDLNFYKNSISVFGKSIISPLSDMGNVYYKFYLADSVINQNRKIYKINFWSKNSKNLALNGFMLIDAENLALTHIEAVLPQKANLNFIKNLQLTQKYKLINKDKWFFDKENLVLNMNYELISDSLHSKPEIYVMTSTTAIYIDKNTDSLETFANSSYKASTLIQQTQVLNETPIFKTLKWIADALITGYAQFGKVDIGKIQNVLRISEIEGLKLSLPFRTNELLWKNISVGGHLSYGSKNNQLNYSGQFQYKLPAASKKLVGISYFDEYRHNFYNENNVIAFENPLISGDEDIAGTLFSFRSAKNLSRRKEFTLSMEADWSNDIESKFLYRNNQIFSTVAFPFIKNGESHNYLSQQSITLIARVSFGERTHEDHLQRIYITNNKPVFYSIIEGGKYNIANNNGFYSKIRAIVKHKIAFDFGQYYYSIEGGTLLGKVPFPLLFIPPGTSSLGYSLNRFGLMNLYEFASDKYISMHNELHLNGLIFNNLPLIKHLNLREMFSFKLFYGQYSPKHSQVIDMPTFSQTNTMPYIEFGVGCSNFLRLFALQVVGRVGNEQDPYDFKWGLRSSIQINF